MNIIEFDGKPISKPGLYSKVPMAAYHGGRLCVGPSISSSGLRTIFSKSPAHYYDKSPLNPDRDDSSDESESFLLGRAAHHLLLGEPRFASEYAVRPTERPDGRPWNGNATWCREWLEERAKEGRAVLTSDQLERIRGMAGSLAKNHLVRQGLLNGIIEATFAWRDHDTGVWLLARPDVVPTESGDFADLKTTVSVAYPDLVKTLGNYGYYQQGALVGEGFKAVTGEDMASFSLLFVESRRPYCTARPYRLKAEDLDLGRRANHYALRQFVRGLNSGMWVGPDGDADVEGYLELSLRQREIAEAKLKR